jgi:hypothetical protein
MKAFRVFVAAALAVLASSARADWVEHFDSGALNEPWVFLDDAGNFPPDASDLDTSGEELTFVGIPQLGVDQFLVGIVGIGEANPLPYVFTDVVASTRVRALQNANLGGGVGLSNNDMFTFVRVQPNLASYLLSLDFGTGSVDLVRVNSPANLTGLADTTIAGFDPSQTYRLELSAIGTQLTGNVYSSSDALLATVSAIDGTFAAGFSGIGAALSTDTGQANTTFIAAAFDDVSSTTIPEPSSAALCAIGGAVLAGAAWRRRRAGR